MPNIHTSVEGRRGCGYRKPGGMYLMGGSLSAPCGKLPRRCDQCPSCGHGMRPARGWTWVDGREWFSRGDCAENPLPLTREVLSDGLARDAGATCHGCPLRTPPERAGLVWIGEKFYPTKEDFKREAATMGISRRLPTRSIPRGLVVGETLVLLAHRKGMPVTCPECNGMGHVQERTGPGLGPCERCNATGRVDVPAIFSAFIPTHLEYVVKGTESEKELEAMEKRGIRLVKVERAPEPQQGLDLAASGE